jgi:hypothetical protein
MLQQFTVVITNRYEEERVVVVEAAGLAGIFKAVRAGYPGWRYLETLQ